MAKKVAVLKGGWSSEREVSLSSGKACANALREAGYDVVEIDVTRDLQKLIADLTPRPDAVFNALHGRGGEDGVMQGVLCMLDLPVTHSGLLASAIAMDKQTTKTILQQHGMPVAKGAIVSRDDVLAGRLPVPAPYVVKPNAEGSSVGVFIVHPGDNKPPLGLDVLPPGTALLVEEFIKGRELTVAVLGSEGEKARALTVTEIKANTTFYDYEAKYADGGSSHILPAPVPAEVFEEAMRLAELAHETLGCGGVSRTDFRYDDSKPGIAGLVFLETNTQPGMTGTSLVPEQAAHEGLSFAALAKWLVDDALWRHRRRQQPDMAPPALPLPPRAATAAAAHLKKRF
jgi:D-alanine-D-alanine ligase